MIKTSDKLNKLVQELVDIDCKLCTDYFNDFIHSEAYFVVDFYEVDYNIIHDSLDLFEKAKSERQPIFEVTDQGDIYAYFIGRESDISRKLKNTIEEAKKELEKSRVDEEKETQKALKEQLKYAEEHVKSLKAKIK